MFEMSEKNRFSVLCEVKNWKVADVVHALKNNGLNECAEACGKREVDGETLLGLSEFALRLWGRDLSIGNMRKLTSFIQDVTNEPEKYVMNHNSSNSDDAWDTDWDDEPDDEKVQRKRKSLRNKTSSVAQNNSSSLRNGKAAYKPPTPDWNHNVKQTGNVSPYDSPSRPPKKLTPPPAFNSAPPKDEKVNTSFNGSRAKPALLSREQFQQNGSQNENRINSLNTKQMKPTFPPRTQLQQNLYKNNPSSGSTAHHTKTVFPSKGQFQQNSIQSSFQANNNNSSSSSSGSISKPALPPTRGTIQQNAVQNSFGEKKPPITAKPQLPARPPPLSATKPSLPKPPAIENGALDLSFINSIPFEPEEYISVDDEDLLREATERKMSLSIIPPEVPPLPPGSRGRSPVPLPPVNDTKEETSSFLHNSFSNLSTKSNEDIPPPLPPLPATLHRNHSPTPNHFYEPENEDSSFPPEDVYESIPEDLISNLRGEYSEGYLLPKELPPPVPILPPKPRNFMVDDVIPHAKVQKSESNSSSSSSLWSLGSLKKKEQSSPNNTLNKKEKSVTPVEKKNNTPPLPRPNHTIPEQRPLPPPPDASESIPKRRVPLVQMPWYFNVDRKKGEDMLRHYDNGTFMIRPSTQTQNPLSLTLKYSERTFNIVVRHRPDGRYALGTAKPTEVSFSSVEELVNHYMNYELELYSNGKPAGSVLLTSSPRKDRKENAYQ